MNTFPSKTRVQFTTRALFLVIVMFAALSAIARQLLSIPHSEAIGTVSAALSGPLVALAVCWVTQHLTAGKVATNAVLVALVALVGVWFGQHFAVYVVGLFVGVLLAQYGGAMLATVGRIAGVTLLSHDENHVR